MSEGGRSSAERSGRGIQVVSVGGRREAGPLEREPQEDGGAGNKAAHERGCEGDSGQGERVGGEEEVPPLAAPAPEQLQCHEQQLQHHQQQLQQPSHKQQQQQHQPPAPPAPPEPLSREVVFSLVAQAVREAARGQPVEVDLTNPDVSE